MAFLEVKTEHFKETHRRSFLDRSYVCTKKVSFQTTLLFAPFEIKRADGVLLAKMYDNGLLEIYPEYAHDGPSGPTWDTYAFVYGSAPHDVIYQALRENLILDPIKYQHCMACMYDDFIDARNEADKTMRYTNRKYGMCKTRAFYTYQAVAKFGEKHALPPELKDYLKNYN